jgi:hypothetical protein
VSDLDRILGPAEPEALCDECFDRLDEYVEAELRGEPADERMSAHLAGCPACREEYESLRDLASG